MKQCGFTGYYDYLENDGVSLFTAVLLPHAGGKFPVVIVRTPYVDNMEEMAEENIVAGYLNQYYNWLASGYSVVVQHCRGRGKSSGNCVPYINERADGLFLQDWIRNSSFYNNELYLTGGSYLTSVHYAVSPFADDIKGAVFNIQDCERYNICYRNGFFKKALHGDWYVGMYKAKSKMKKSYTFDSFDILPLSDFSKTVFGESAGDFDEMLKHPERDDAFWNTLWGGNDARDAVKNVKFPVLITTGFYDIYTGGIFDIWNNMSAQSRAKSALLVSPYDHGDGCAENSIRFPDGKKTEKFGSDFEINWFNYIRGKCSAPFEPGKVTYYRLFDNIWRTDTFTASEKVRIPLGDKEIQYVYNPYNPPSFNGGLSCNFGGAQFQEKPNSRYDIISIYTAPSDRDIFVKGKMGAELSVSSDCEDTCFYMRISIEKENGDYGLRDDITSLCFQYKDYIPGSRVKLSFNFDEHAFLIKKGERLRIDVSSADNAHYVRHTNQKGLYSEQTTCRIAKNTVFLKDSYLELPIE
jgi:predicted acyl esterase